MRTGIIIRLTGFGSWGLWFLGCSLGYITVPGRRMVSDYLLHNLSGYIPLLMLPLPLHKLLCKDHARPGVWHIVTEPKLTSKNQISCLIATQKQSMALIQHTQYTAVMEAEHLQTVAPLMPLDFVSKTRMCPMVITFRGSVALTTESDIQMRVSPFACNLIREGDTRV